MVKLIARLLDIKSRFLFDRQDGYRLAFRLDPTRYKMQFVSILFFNGTIFVLSPWGSASVVFGWRGFCYKRLGPFALSIKLGLVSVLWVGYIREVTSNEKGEE